MSPALTDANTQVALAQGLAALTPKLGPDQVLQAAIQVVAAIERATDSEALDALVRALAGLGIRFASDQAVAVLMFEVLKYPWVSVEPLAEVLEKRFGLAPKSINSIGSLIELGQARFQGIVDLESPPKAPADITAAVRRAMGGVP